MQSQLIVVSVYRDSDKQLWPVSNSDAWNLATLLGDLWTECNLPEITSSLRARARRLGLLIRITKQA